MAISQVLYFRFARALVNTALAPNCLVGIGGLRIICQHDGNCLRNNRQHVPNIHGKRYRVKQVRIPNRTSPISISAVIGTNDNANLLDINRDVLNGDADVTIDDCNDNQIDSLLHSKKKMINFLFLSISFGYSLYTILSIDSGLTRGWSASEIAMRIPFDNWGAYESYLATKPIATKTSINVIIYLLGDWLSQTICLRKNLLDFDLTRTLRNGFIGLCFGPLVHEYYEFSDTILPPENGLMTRLEKILMDQTIYLTVKCSIYVSAVTWLNGADFKTVVQTVKQKNTLHYT